MKLAILGSRGFPSTYGGYETLSGTSLPTSYGQGMILRSTVALAMKDGARGSRKVCAVLLRRDAIRSRFRH